MQVPERIEYLNKFRMDGDIKAIADLFGLSLSTVSDIIKGKFFGPNGEKVLQKMEEIIDERKKKAKNLARKYKRKLNGSV